MIFTRWAAAERCLPATEVDGYFGDVTDRTLLFAFETDRMAVEPHGGHLSVKVVVRGEERYHLAGRSVRLEPGRVLVLNAGERYASSIDRPGTRSLSFFLPPREVGLALASGAPVEDALRDGLAGTSADPDVTQAPFRPNAALAAAVSRLGALALARSRPDLVALDEAVRRVAAGALGAALGLARPGALAHCRRRSTREELTARVLRARELIEDRGGRVSLAAMADAACLSPYHFLRAFQEVTGQTPAAYARVVRLARGLAELTRRHSLRSAARVAGFDSPSSFLRAVRRESAREPAGPVATIARRAFSQSLHRESR